MPDAQVPTTTVTTTPALTPSIPVPADPVADRTEIPLQNELSTAAFSHLERVGHETAEYVQVMLRLGSFDVFLVYEVRNETLDMQSAIAISGATKICSQKMLYGTSFEAVDSIVREDFKVGGVAVKDGHGAANGRGIYLTAQAATAASYRRKERSKCIILSETIVTPACFKQTTRPPGLTVEAFEGAANAGATSEGGRVNPMAPEYSIVVQPDKALVRPLYVVEFKGDELQRRCARMWRGRLSVARAARAPDSAPAPSP